MTTATILGYGALPRLLGRLTGDEKHDPSSHSTLDVLWVLYDRILRVDAAAPDDPDRDRFLLSKGHGPAAYYAVLAAKGFFPEEWLDDFGSFASPLGYHPDGALVPGVEIASGSLGHGLGIGVGIALAGRQVYVLVGDGELDEGSSWEAIQYAGRVGLERLTVVAVDNSSATHGWPGGIEARFLTEGWTAERADGRDHDALERAFRAGGAGRPHLVVAEVRR
jgi:transketolase